MTRKQYRLTRRFMVILAAAPLLQLSQCKTGTSQVLQGIANQMPSTIFSILQSALLSPLFSLLSGGSTNTGGFGGTGSTGGGI